ncbi:MAG: prolyl 4-hydroxylase [Minwuia thermotolerans]|nr:MAG: prolyl 4-hydroxylase [Minwuia thermotolerans]
MSAPDWNRIRSELDERGFARLPGLLGTGETASLRPLFADNALFRNHVVMQRHGYGQGSYKYFNYPLPQRVADLRHHIYAELAPLANQWMDCMGKTERFPDRHDDYLAACHEAGQVRPTPLLLDYGPGDYNRLHQDLYGEMHFPIQLVVMLSAPDTYSGGAFVLTEARPRMQSRAEAIMLEEGEGLLFAVNQRPVPGKRGYFRVTMRHGVSTVTAGHRQTLGVIFHDAR